MRIEDKRQIADTTNDADSSVNQAQTQPQPAPPSLASSSLDVDWSTHAPHLPDFSGMVDSAKSAVVGYVKGREAQVKGDVKDVMAKGEALQKDLQDPNVRKYLKGSAETVKGSAGLATSLFDLAKCGPAACEGDPIATIKTVKACAGICQHGVELTDGLVNLQQSKAQGGPEIAQFNQHLREFIASAAALNRDAGIH